MQTPGASPGSLDGALFTTGKHPKPLPMSPFPPRTHWMLALNNQLVAAPAFEDRFGYFPIEGDRIVAYDLVGGTQRWMVAAAPRSAPAVGGGLLFVDQPGNLTALRTTDGSTAWTVPFGETLVTPLVWHDGWLVAATATELFAARAEDGMLAWRQPIAGIRAAPSLARDRVYVPLADNRVLALRRDTGATIWERKIGGAPNEILALDDRIFLGSNDNHLYAIKAEDGVIDWRWPTGADIVSKPVADDERIYFVSFDNVLRALNRKNGVQQWKRPLPFRPLWSPVKAADVLIVSGVSGAPRAFFLKNGAPAGEFAATLALTGPSTRRSLSSGFSPLQLLQPVIPGLPPQVIANLPGSSPIDLLPGELPVTDLSGRASAFPTTLDSSVDMVAPVYAFDAPNTLGPMIIVVRRTIALGANVAAVSRSIEPLPMPGVSVPQILPITPPNAPPGFVPKIPPPTI